MTNARRDTFFGQTLTAERAAALAEFGVASLDEAQPNVRRFISAAWKQGIKRAYRVPAKKPLADFLRGI